MASSSISVTTDSRALKRLDRQLGKELPEAIKRELRAQMPKIGMDFVAQARLLAPYKTGELRDAISYRVDSGGLAVNLFVDSDKMTPVTVQGRQLPGVFRAYWLEFGTSKMPGSQYFYGAWRTKKRAYKARIKRAAKKGAQAL